jgi:thiosulfate/3-mercaptopyruvate sulfurtransferase
LNWADSSQERRERYSSFMKTAMMGLMAALALAALAADMALIEPKDLAAQLASKPAVFQVGPNVLYRSKHIPGAVFAGPGRDANGLDLLKAAVEKLPRDREIVIYCGCCPWDRCPNVKPAADLLRQMGFTKAKVLHLTENFATNWIDKGYPVEH